MGVGVVQDAHVLLPARAAHLAGGSRSGYNSTSCAYGSAKPGFTVWVIGRVVCSTAGGLGNFPDTARDRHVIVCARVRVARRGRRSTEEKHERSAAFGVGRVHCVHCHVSDCGADTRFAPGEGHRPPGGVRPAAERTVSGARRLRSRRHGWRRDFLRGPPDSDTRRPVHCGTQEPRRWTLVGHRADAARQCWRRHAPATGGVGLVRRRCIRRRMV